MRSSPYKPSRPHDPLVAPGMCMCSERCAEAVLTLRCKTTDSDGNQCGDYSGHSSPHTQLVATSFDIAAARLRERGELR